MERAQTTVGGRPTSSTTVGDATRTDPPTTGNSREGCRRRERTHRRRRRRLQSQPSTHSDVCLRVRRGRWPDPEWRYFSRLLRSDSYSERRLDRLRSDDRRPVSFPQSRSRWGPGPRVTTEVTSTPSGRPLSPPPPSRGPGLGSEVIPPVYAAWKGREEEDAPPTEEEEEEEEQEESAEEEE